MIINGLTLCWLMGWCCYLAIKGGAMSFASAFWVGIAFFCAILAFTGNTLTTGAEYHKQKQIFLEQQNAKQN